MHDYGGLAEYFIPVSKLHAIPEGVTQEQAAWGERLATPINVVRSPADPETGPANETVAMLAAGAIGLLVLAAALPRSAKRIVMTDMLVTKRERALRLGAEAVVDAAGPDVVGRVREAWRLENSSAANSTTRARCARSARAGDDRASRSSSVGHQPLGGRPSMMVRVIGRSSSDSVVFCRGSALPESRRSFVAYTETVAARVSKRAPAHLVRRACSA
jgi:Zn-dependent alcohol dehydrogenase